MIILTYVIRTLCVLGLIIAIPLCYAMVKDVMTWGKDEN